MTVRASRGRSLLVALLAAAGVRALALAELPATGFAVAAFAVLGLAWRDIVSNRPITTLALDGDGLWHVGSPDGERFAGRLLDAGYRSAALIVLELERVHVPPAAPDRAPDPARARRSSPRAWVERRARRRRVAVFADSVDAADFSFLHLQLAFATRRPTDDPPPDPAGRTR